MIKLEVQDIAVIKSHRGVTVALMGDFPTHRIEFETSSEARAYLKSIGIVKYRSVDLINDTETEVIL